MSTIADTTMTTHMRRVALVGLVSTLGLFVAFATRLEASSVDAASAPVEDAPAVDHVATDQVTVRLLSEHRSMQPGRTLELGLRFELAEHWHVYWRNPGDSGEPPRVRWLLPSGFDAGPLLWPTPRRIELPPLVNFGYEHAVLLPASVAVPPDVDAGATVRITADVSWLVCRAEECIPGQARLVLGLPVDVGEPKVDERNATLFARARAAVAPERPATFRDLDVGAVSLEIEEVAARAGDVDVSFFPLTAGVVEDFSGRIAGSPDGVLHLRLMKSDQAPAALEKVDGLVVIGRASAAADDDGDRAQAFLVHAVAATGASAVAAPPLGLALLLAFSGGLLLNLMPCVFPVLSLKVLGFVEQAHHEPRRIRLHGWAFAAGVLGSFWVLAVTLIVLRAGGAQLGWGFQLQSPTFLASLCALLLVLALSLGGAFELGLWMTTLGAAGAGRTGYAGSLWTGALATVVATPCTAPFMGPALGFALTQSAPVSLAVFSALAAGMASPYVVLAHFPRALSRLPKPGGWMQTVRQLTAFPLYATVLWLLYVFQRQTSVAAAWRLMTGLLFVAMAAWGWGVLQRRERKGIAGSLLVATVAAVGLAVGVSAARSPAAAAFDRPVADAFWGRWSPEHVIALRREGRPVFVNFTADWCISCQVNEATVFSTTAVRELFSRHGVEALKADWTNADARIARALGEFGRDGVPLYVFYPSDAAEDPRILPQLPTRSILEEVFKTSPRSARRNSFEPEENRG